MQNCSNIEELKSIKVLSDSRWNKDDSKSLLMHSIHIYPAKFPPIIAEEAFYYAQEEGVNCQKVADIFCGCGTVALESKKRNISFWGCDINPVAILIAKAKTNCYDLNRLQLCYYKIKNEYAENLKKEICADCYENASDRLKYWFSETTYKKLYYLKAAIDELGDDLIYLTAFRCIFSSILKSTSKWLQKSIKPQIDPNKKVVEVESLFDQRFNMFIKAVKEENDCGYYGNDISIVHKDFLTHQEKEKVDLIITSPPYVTSYEYADLHQLSSLWLGYTDDYRKLRKGSIGSTYNIRGFNLNLASINNTGREIVNGLISQEIQAGRCGAIARYYMNVEKAVGKCAKMLNKDGMALFVIGNSELKGVKLLNSDHLVESMIDKGFTDIKIGKRTIEKSMCVPFRDSKGKFTKRNNSKNEIYHEEFIISGRIR